MIVSSAPGGSSGLLQSRGEDGVAVAMALAERVRHAFGAPSAWLNVQVLVASGQASLPLGAFLACHGASVAVVAPGHSDAVESNRVLRELLVRMNAAFPHVHPGRVSTLLAEGLEGHDWFTVQTGDLVSAAHGGRAFDVLVTLDDEALAIEVVRALGLEPRHVLPLPIPAPRAGRATLIACRRPANPLLEFPTDDASSQTLAHSRARYEFAMQFVPGKRVLDVGCGAGIGTRMLLRAGAASVDGVDKREEALAIARGREPGRAAAYRQCDLNEGLPYESGAFDVVICLEVLEHVEQQRLLAAEVHRVLADGGLAVFSVPHAPFEDFWAHVNDERNPFHAHVPDAAELRGLLAEFPSVSLFVQTDIVASVVLPLDQGPEGNPGSELREGRLHVWPGLGLQDLDTLVIMAVCSKSPGAERDAARTLASPVAVTYSQHQGRMAEFRRLVQRLEDERRERLYAEYTTPGRQPWLAAVRTRGRHEPMLHWLMQTSRFTGIMAVKAGRRLARRLGLVSSPAPADPPGPS